MPKETAIIAGNVNRPAKVIIAVIGLDQHEVGSLTVARMLTDAGMEVVYLGRFNTPQTVVAAAIDEDADVVGVSCHSWEYLEFSSDLVSLLRPLSIPAVFGGSVITSADAALLRSNGVADLFGSSSTKEEIIAGVQRCADDHRAMIERPESIDTEQSALS
jgi:methylmalonyl-CoA mutase C-terminal domain/subunit